METKIIPAFNIIGITVKTTNENNQAASDIPALWKKFMEEGILQKIPNKVNNEIYSMYTDYESDFTRPYTTIIGCKVENLNEIPEGMVGKTVEGSTYNFSTTKGDLSKGVIINHWSKIWQSNIKRAYTTDFEIYGEKASNPQNAEVEFYVAVK
ncbi:GyrI-like domain-containing protein [Polaribacter sp.]|nr:GyrI-like domain-containing protein [Polaribacter sp.]